ncbi:hypothetical protein Goklo_029547 [Gossypium klotzschianum]|uniref:Uncharacterized protein n=1 Tax=Gossypium klotzschianum TaxID=34286 RepID=A0A7J8W5P0_9ROSI|nr:hypothetical protein [Gossypium klotzschianum]
MGETSAPLRQTPEPNPTFLEFLFHDLGAVSLILLHNSGPEEEEIELKQTPTTKQVKFSSSVGVSRKGSFVLAQSVHDFSVTLRKENRKPPVRSGMELTPPPTSGKNRTRENGVWPSNLRESKSANAGEKKGRMMMLKKSVASVEDLKGISLAVANAINGENRGGNTSARGAAGKGNTTLGYI